MHELGRRGIARVRCRPFIGFTAAYLQDIRQCSVHVHNLLQTSGGDENCPCQVVHIYVYHNIPEFSQQSNEYRIARSQSDEMEIIRHAIHAIDAM